MMQASILSVQKIKNKNNLMMIDFIKSYLFYKGNDKRNMTWNNLHVKNEIANIHNFLSEIIRHIIIK